jgi:hypothetical protein
MMFCSRCAAVLDAERTDRASWCTHCKAVCDAPWLVLPGWVLGVMVVLSQATV